tara:strand:- start:59 stop:214 length:156 start_codon:yes stop_codon:yes gene_type:complete
LVERGRDGRRRRREKKKEEEGRRRKKKEEKLYKGILPYQQKPEKKQVSVVL